MYKTIGYQMLYF